MLDQTGDIRPGNIRQVVKLSQGQPTSDGAGVKLNARHRQRSSGRARSVPAARRVPLGRRRRTTSRGFPDHPHRGFETVTYMLAGRMRHGDNQGNSGLLRPGSVQWMTAGRGIVHSEMPEQEDGLMWGFQLWVNLPAADKMTAPRYQDIEPEQHPGR